MPHRSPDLHFGPGNSSGFTPAGIAAFDNLRPAAVVRELIQNALDAAHIAGVMPARVRFQLTRTRRKAIPGIANFEKAFAKAIKTQTDMAGGSLARQAELLVARIQGALAADEVDVLTVLDNGVGLDEERMNALLSDGVSIKDGDATGTYGNGHSTAIPASDLRYVLYGGITAQGKRIGSGHAVLASHHAKGQRHLRSGDGFFIRDFQAGNGKLFAYSRGPGLSALILDALKQIKSETTHGSAVIIPAFNHFLERDTLWDMVSHAASANFFVAIEDGQLEVTVEDHRERADAVSSTLNRTTLAEVLRAHENKQRAPAFLNGRRAFEAHQAYRVGERHRIKTSAGEIEIRLLESPSGATRVDLCRNGMWITDDRKIPGFYQRFTDQAPFHAILSLNARIGRKLHDYIRVAEGPLHDSIAMKRLPPRDRTACRKALRQVSDWILKNTPTVKSDAYTPTDFLTLAFGDDAGPRRDKSRSGFWGIPVPVERNPVRELPVFPIKPAVESDDAPDPDRPDKPFDPPDPRSQRRRPSLPTYFQVASRPVGKNRRRIVIECSRDFTNAELRLVVDEALDATCERHGQDAYTPAALTRVRIDGKAAHKSALRRLDNEAIGVHLGDLRAGTSVEIEVSYRLTGDFADLPNPSLRVEVCKSDDDAGREAPNAGFAENAR